MDNIIKPSSLVDIENVLTLAQRKVYNVLLEYSRQNINDASTFSMSIKAMREKTGEFTFKNNGDVVEQIKSIGDMPMVQINILGKDKKYPLRVMVNLLAQVVYDEAHETVSWSFPPFLLEMLKRYNTTDSSDIGMYTRLPLAVQSKFDSKHALALWEFCRSRFDERRGYAESPFITLEDLNKLFNCNYDTWYRLNSKIISKAIQNIHKHEPTYFISITEQKARHKVIAVKFIIQRRLSGFPIAPKQERIVFEAPTKENVTKAQQTQDQAKNAAVEKFMASLSPAQQERIMEEAEQSIPELLQHPQTEQEQVHYQLLLRLNRNAIVESLVKAQQGL